MTHRINFDVFRRNLNNARIIKGWSSKMLSEAAGLKQHKRISDIEDGRGSPTIEEIHSICKVLGQSVGNMLYENSEMALRWESENIIDSLNQNRHEG